MNDSVSFRNLQLPSANRKGQEGLTLVELLIGIAIFVLVCFGAGAAWHAIQNANATFNFTWTTAPPAIPPAPGTGTFVYHVTRQLDKISPVENYAGRSVKFDLAVSQKAGTIVSCNGVALSPQPATTCTADSDAGGNITLVVSLEKDGVATLTPTDIKSGKSDPPQSFSAP
jgi:hypothetical protein